MRLRPGKPISLATLWQRDKGAYVKSRTSSAQQTLARRGIAWGEEKAPTSNQLAALLLTSKCGCVGSTTVLREVTHARCVRQCPATGIAGLAIRQLV